jgi:hypothetical protein
VVGKGYRFVAAVEAVSSADAIPIAEPRDDRRLDTSVAGGEAVRSGASVLTPYSSRLTVGLFACAVIVAFAVWIWAVTRHTTPVKLAVLPFANLTGNMDCSTCPMGSPKKPPSRSRRSLPSSSPSSADSP